MLVDHRLANTWRVLQTRLGFMERCVGSGDVRSLVGSRDEIPKAPVILRYLNPENS